MGKFFWSWRWMLHFNKFVFKFLLWHSYLQNMVWFFPCGGIRNIHLWMAAILTLLVLFFFLKIVFFGFSVYLIVNIFLKILFLFSQLLFLLFLTFKHNVEYFFPMLIFTLLHSCFLSQSYLFKYFHSCLLLLTLLICHNH